MSRCFPFPPRGYSGKCSSNEALILWIKLQQEREKSVSGREREQAAKSSERKKDRKEKKEKKREERRASSGIVNEKQELKEKMYQVDKGRVERNSKCVVREDESEQLEKSSVTEEHGWPALQNVTCSTDSTGDSTGNSCKRKRLSASPNCIQSNGNIIRIRLCSSHDRDEPRTSGSREHETIVPLHRRSDHDASYSKLQTCSNIIRMELSNRQRDVTVRASQELSHQVSTRNAAIQSVSRQDKALPCLPGRKTESAVPKAKLSSHEKKLRKRDLKYNKLFESWVPFPLETGLVVDGDDSDDWLFGKKGEDRAAKRLKSGDVESFTDNIPSCSSSALQPRSHSVADADIYALPFTLQF